jgi:hypothetical protein
MRAASERNDQSMRTARNLVLSAFLVLGVAACLATWAQGSSLAHSVSAAVVLAHRADRSTYLVGEVAHRVDDISEALDEQPGETSIVAAKVQVARDFERLDRAMRAPSSGALFWFRLPVHPGEPTGVDERIRSHVVATT